MDSHRQQLSSDIGN